MTSIRRVLTSGLSITALLIVLALPPAVVAHGGITAGPYQLELGWRSEPAVVGQQNAVGSPSPNWQPGKP